MRLPQVEQILHTLGLAGLTALPVLGPVEIDQTLGAIFRSPDADLFRKKTGAFRECNVCTEPGLERIAWPLEGFSLLRMLDRIGEEDFDLLIQHMGIGKYL